MKKIFSLALLSIAALGIGSLMSVKESRVSRADPEPEPVPVLSLQTIYDYNFDNFENGSVTPQQVFDDGLLWVEGDYVDSVVKSQDLGGGTSMKVLDMTVINVDGGNYARMMGIGSGGLANLVSMRGYELSMYLDLSQVTATSELYIEYKASNFWTGVIIKNGQLTPCDPTQIHNISYKNNIFTMSFTARPQAHQEPAGVRPYIFLTMANAENSDVVTVGNLTIKEAATYAERYEGYAVGTQAATDSKSDIVNVYNANLDYVKIDEDTDGNYLHIKHNNTSDEDVWKHFYFNRMDNLTSGHIYRAQMTVFEHNFKEMYIKYNDTNDMGTNTFLPNGTIAEWSNPSTYLTNVVWDGEFLSQDILFTSAKNSTWWPQFAVEFCVPANTELDVRIDDFYLYDVTALGSTQLKTYGADSFILGQEFSQKDLSVKYVRADGEEVDAELVTVNSDSYNKDVIGEYPINITAGDGLFTLTTSYQASVHNNVDHISMNTNPTKVQYEYNEELDLTGAKIDVVKENGEESIVDVTADMVSGYNKQGFGQQTVTVTYGGKSTTFVVEVLDHATSISMKSNPTKTQYKYGEELDLTGAVLVLNKTSGATEDVDVTAAMVSGYNKNQLGQQTITVTYQTFTTTFQVTVVDYIASIAMKTNPTKVEYVAEDELDISGAVITVTMASGATQDVNVTAAMVSGFIKGKGGEQTITVTYEGKTTSFKVTVNLPDPEPQVEPKPEKKGCKSSIVATSAIISIISLAGFGLLAFRKKED